MRLEGSFTARPDWAMRAQPYGHELDATWPILLLPGESDEPTPQEAHLHRALEIGVVVTGVQEIRYTDFSLAVAPGQVWLCSVWEPHAWRMAQSGTRSAVLIFLPQAIEQMIGEELSWLSMFAAPPDQRPHSFAAPLGAAVLALGQEMLREAVDGAPGWASMVRLRLAQLLLLLRRNWDLPLAQGREPYTHASSLARVMPALALLNADPGRRVHWQEAAAACGLSLSRFHHLFREAMGSSFERFCRQTRLEYAAHLLASTDLGLDAIASQTDFADASHLHRHFAKHFGHTPGDYRRARHGERGPALEGRAEISPRAGLGSH